MIRSMTAYAARETATGSGQLTWELRSVNQRYLDISPRMPEEFRVLEPDVRQRLKGRLSRGKVEANLRFHADPGVTSSRLVLNQELAESLGRLLAEMSDRLADAARPDPGRLLTWPGMVIEERPDFSDERETALNLLDEALDALVEAREQEGRAIAGMLESRLERIEAQIDQVREHLPAIREALKQRFSDRLAGLDQPVEPGRMEQEIVIQLQKLDVDEELDRLAAHVTEIRRVIGLDEPAGRRLDFLMQELNREANTLGSKASVVETGQAAVELKVLIEQMREQVQNVE